MTYKIKLIKYSKYNYIRKLNNHTIIKYKFNIKAFEWKYIYSEIDLELLYDKLISNMNY